MIILSHRGYWKTPDEKNQPIAFERSFRLGFGTETDVRDYLGQIVIAHDPVVQPALRFEDFLSIYTQFGAGLPLAINIKADGLQTELLRLFTLYGVENYFLFDMSVPDAVRSFSAGLKVFTRRSELESVPPFYDQAEGVWVDGFFTTWFDKEEVTTHVNKGKRVCLVSPELHKRPHMDLWSALNNEENVQSASVMLCTDFPEDARRFFHG